MADELELTLNLRLQDTVLGVDFAKNITTQQFDWNSDKFASGLREIAIGSNQELASDYTFTGPIWVFVKNTTVDGTTPEAYVEIRYGSGGSTVATTLYAGQWNILTIDNSAVFARAYNDVVNLEFIIIDQVN